MLHPLGDLTGTCEALHALVQVVAQGNLEFLGPVCVRLNLKARLLLAERTQASSFSAFLRLSCSVTAADQEGNDKTTAHSNGQMVRWGVVNL